MKAADLYRVLIAAVMVATLLAVLSWLQGRFDTSDLEKGTALVSRYRPPAGGKSLERAILDRHPGARPDDLSWSSEIKSGCLGHVRVYATVAPEEPGLRGETYAFDVALTAGSVHPTDERTIAILKSLTTTTATASR